MLFSFCLSLVHVNCNGSLRTFLSWVTQYFRPISFGMNLISVGHGTVLFDLKIFEDISNFMSRRLSPNWELHFQILG